MSAHSSGDVETELQETRLINHRVLEAQFHRLHDLLEARLRLRYAKARTGAERHRVTHGDTEFAAQHRILQHNMLHRIEFQHLAEAPHDPVTHAEASGRPVAARHGKVHYYPEDALADTFTTALERLDQYREREVSIWYWLARVAANKANDRHRAAARGGRALQSFERMLEGRTAGKIVFTL